MKKLLIKKKVTAQIFIIILFAYGLINGYSQMPLLTNIVDQWKTEGSKQSVVVSRLNHAIEDNVYLKNYFTDAYGYMQLVLGKSEVNHFEIVRDYEGKLHFTEQDSAVGEVSYEEIISLSELAKSTDTKLLYILPLTKNIKGYTRFPKGMSTADADKAYDRLLIKLEKFGIEYIDLRDCPRDEKILESKLFYDTDSHWTTEAAFWASEVVSDYLEKNYGESLDADGFYKDLQNYNAITYDDVFLGNMGRRTGRFYAGVDDFTFIYPNFTTNYIFESTALGDIKFSGRFEEALTDRTVIRRSDKPYETDLYSLYLYGNTGFSHVENVGNPDGIRVCMIKDSFALPFSAFFSLRCSVIDLIDPRYFEGDWKEQIKNGSYDYIFVMHS